MNILHRCLVYAFLLFLPSWIHAQIEGPLVRYFSKSTYKAGTQNWAITMDKSGLIYFGNNKGLLEYDGDKWRLYRLPNRTIVRSIDIDSLGNIYVGGQNEIGRFQNTNGKLMEYQSLTHLIPESHRDFEGVWEIFSMGKKRIYCSEKEVFIFNGEKVKTVLPESGRFENYFEVDGKIYLQDSETGLYILKGNELEFLFDSDSYKNDRIIGLLTFSDKFLAITQEQGIYQISGDSLIEMDNPASRFIKDNKAYTCQKLKDGNLLIGTVLNGLIVVNPKGDILRSFNKSNGLENNTILCALEDPSGNVWLGLDNGINHVELNSPFNFINSINNLEGTGYTAFKKNGITYLGTNQGLFSKRINSQNYQLTSSKASQIWGHSHIDNSHYIHAHEGSFLLSDDELSPISPVQGAWKMIALKSRPGIWLQGTYEGFFVYRKQDGNIPVLIGKLKGFSESARIFEEDEEGFIWISHAYRGLYRLKLNSEGDGIDDVKRYNSQQGLPDDLYLTVSKIRGEIVFTASKGIYKFISDDDVFKPHKGLSELIGNEANVLKIMEDETGNVWFCTDTEFGRISIESSGVYNEVEVSYLNEIQEDLVDGFEDVFMLDETTAYIPVETGFIKFDTQKPIQKVFSYGLLFRGIYETSRGDSLVAKGLELEKPFNLSAKNNNLSINYVLPSYQNLNSVHYQYRLLGKNEDWSEWTSQTKKEYNNLASGEYTFQVKARNSHKMETPVAEFNFSILPPWYLSTSAKVAYVLVIALGFLLFYRVVKMKEVKKRLEFEEESQETLQRKEEELKRISEKSESEIIKLRNEKLRADIRHKNSELASTTMHLVQKSEILQKIKSELNELSRAKDSDQLQVKVKQIERAIEADVRLDKNWERFESHFDQVHENFFKNLRAKFPNLTPKDQKLCAYLRMNLSTKEIAPLLNISVRGVEISRYRLRKKLHLNSEENLVSFIMEV